MGPRPPCYSGSLDSLKSVVVRPCGLFWLPTNSPSGNVENLEAENHAALGVSKRAARGA